MGLFNDVIRVCLLATAMAVGFSVIGCGTKETLLDVNTPDGGVQIERSTKTGEITVDVDE